jgi:hypothetical protein
MRGFDKYSDLPARSKATALYYAAEIDSLLSRMYSSENETSPDAWFPALHRLRRIILEDYNVWDYRRPLIGMINDALGDRDDVTATMVKVFEDKKWKRS